MDYDEIIRNFVAGGLPTNDLSKLLPNEKRYIIRYFKSRISCGKKYLYMIELASQELELLDNIPFPPKLKLFNEYKEYLPEDACDQNISALMSLYEFQCAATVCRNFNRKLACNLYTANTNVLEYLKTKFIEELDIHLSVCLSCLLLQDKNPQIEREFQDFCETKITLAERYLTEIA